MNGHIIKIINERGNLIHEIFKSFNCAYKNWYSLEKGLYSVDIKIDHWVLDCHPPPNVGNPQLLYILHRTGFCWTANTLHGVIIYWYYFYVKFLFVYI